MFWPNPTRIRPSRPAITCRHPLRPSPTGLFAGLELLRRALRWYTNNNQLVRYENGIGWSWKNGDRFSDIPNTAAQDEFDGHRYGEVLCKVRDDLMEDLKGAFDSSEESYDVINRFEECICLASHYQSQA